MVMKIIIGMMNSDDTRALLNTIHCWHGRILLCITLMYFIYYSLSYHVDVLGFLNRSCHMSVYFGSVSLYYV